MPDHVFITGATGLIGGEVLARLLRSDAAMSATVLLRSESGWPALKERLGPLHRRVTVVSGDVGLPGLGLEADERRRIGVQTDLVVHCAADTRFSQPLGSGRRLNRDGTRRMLELAAGCRRLARVVHVSTAFTAGRMTGRVPEAPLDGAAGWVNAYEQSKHEAEHCVRDSGLPAVIVRPSTIVCDGADGRISQINAVHRALLLCRAGLAAMVPGSDETLVDLVTTDYVAGGITRLALDPAVPGGTYHLCSGDRALPLGELLDRAFSFWSHDARWRRRAIARPSLASLDTYRLFEQSVHETGDARLRAITRSLTHFVPQLALPKLFDTAAADAALGYAAQPVRSYWGAVLQQLAMRRAIHSRRAA
jgi:2-alkyl-3-oxoalkanoate reductase